jgi:hypothetical protein
MKLFNEVDNLAKYLKQSHPEFRLGQSLMNALREVNMELYQKITATDADCFYQDDKIPQFWEAIKGVE